MLSLEIKHVSSFRAVSVALRDNRSSALDLAIVAWRMRMRHSGLSSRRLDGMWIRSVARCE